MQLYLNTPAIVASMAALGEGLVEQVVVQHLPAEA